MKKGIAAAAMITAIVAAMLWWVLPYWRRKSLEMSVEDKNVQAFLEMIRYAEGTDRPDGYNVTFGYKHFTDMSDHPAVTGEWEGETYRGNLTTAAGAFQITRTTWNRVGKAKLKLTDFSPRSQQLVAIELLKERKVLDAVKAGKVREAIVGYADKPHSGANKEWASLPDSPYGQPMKTLAQVQQEFVLNGGNIA